MFFCDGEMKWWEDWSGIGPDVDQNPDTQLGPKSDQTLIKKSDPTLDQKSDPSLIKIPTPHVGSTL